MSIVTFGSAMGATEAPKSGNITAALQIAEKIRTVDQAQGILEVAAKTNADARRLLAEYGIMDVAAGAAVAARSLLDALTARNERVAKELTGFSEAYVKAADQAFTEHGKAVTAQSVAGGRSREMSDLGKSFGAFIKEWQGQKKSAQVTSQYLGKLREWRSKLAKAGFKLPALPEFPEISRTLANNVALLIVHNGQAFSLIDAQVKEGGWLSAFGDAFKTTIAGIIGIPVTILNAALAGAREVVSEGVLPLVWTLLPVLAIGGGILYLVGKAKH